MKTKYGIPQDQLDEIVKRDKDCVYCHKTMISPHNPKQRSDSETIEHLSHRHDWDSIDHCLSRGEKVNPVIAICCGACNSSRSDLPLKVWFKRKYCLDRNITEKTVSKVVKNYIKIYE